MPLPSNALDAAIAKMLCCKDSGTGPAPEMQYQSVYLGLRLRFLAETYPEQMEPSTGPIGSCVNWLPEMLRKIECGETIRDCAEFWETMARIEIAFRDGAAADV